MPKEQREDFERRLLALVRDQLDILDRDYADGWEISEFVITARTYSAPEPGTPLNAWAGGPYPGWEIFGWTRGSGPAYWHDAELLSHALENTRMWHDELLQQWAAKDEEDEEDDDVEE